MDMIPKYTVNGTEIDLRVLELVRGSDPAINETVDKAKYVRVALRCALQWRSQWPSGRLMRLRSRSGTRSAAFAEAFAAAERKTDTGNPDDELAARVYALILVMVEYHRGNVVNVFEHVLHDIRYLALLFQKLDDTNLDEMILLLQDDAQNIASCRARLNTAMEIYAVDSRIRNAVGLAELGTGIRTMKELVVTGVQEHQLVPPFVHQTGSSGLSADIASQIAWMGHNPPWNSSDNFADLLIGWHTGMGKVVLKRLQIDDTLGKAVEQPFERERDMWQRLRHDNLLQLLGSFNHDGFRYFVSPFMKNGSLASYIERNLFVNRTRLLREIANAIKYLHEEGIVHGDIKADNILLSDDLHAQLCEPGLAKFFGTSTATALKGVENMQWQSPELWEGKPKTAESDVYAFGMTIVEVLTSHAPFPHLETLPSLYTAVHVQGQRPPMEPKGSSSGESYKDSWHVAEQCWQADPNERISMSDAYNGLDPDAEQADDSCPAIRALSLLLLVILCLFQCIPSLFVLFLASLPLPSTLLLQQYYFSCLSVLAG